MPLHGQRGGRVDTCKKNQPNSELACLLNSLLFPAYSTGRQSSTINSTDTREPSGPSACDLRACRVVALPACATPRVAVRAKCTQTTTISHPTESNEMSSALFACATWHNVAHVESRVERAATTATAAATAAAMRERLQSDALHGPPPCAHAHFGTESR